MVIRPIEANEYEELRTTWCEVFGDDPIFVDELYYSMAAQGFVAEDDDKLHSFLTLFEAGSFRGKPVLVSYGVCTKPESRGKGYARELAYFVKEKVVQTGAISMVCPAEPSLISFYSKIGYRPTFYAKDTEADTEYMDIPLELQVNMLTASEYNRFREAFLLEVPHVTFNEDFVSFVRNDSVNAQGLLLINDGDAICTLNYGNDEEIGISELIVNPALTSVTSEISEQIAGGLARLFEVRKCYFREPGFIVYTDQSGDYFSDGTYVQAMSCGADVDIDEAALLPYYGFPID